LRHDDRPAECGGIGRGRRNAGRQQRGAGQQKRR
jgi:hypothetical protein